MDIKDILISNYDYTMQEAETMTSDLSKLDDRIMPIFEAWKIKGNESNSLAFHGYSIDLLRTNYNMNFFAALITLDWIVKDPENALPAIKQGIM